jgi:hypothetical protein
LVFCTKKNLATLCLILLLTFPSESENGANHFLQKKENNFLQIWRHVPKA